MKILVITGQAGHKGEIKDPSMGSFPNVDYVAYTDKPLQVSTWQCRHMPQFSTDSQYAHRRNAKLGKVLGWLLEPGYDYYVWHDSVCEIQVHPQQLISDHMHGHTQMALWRHPERDCAYEEADKVAWYGVEHEHLIQASKQFLQEHNWPPHAGLFELTSFVYKNTAQVQQALLCWWELICRYSSRDQILFPYVLHKHNICYSVLPGCALAYAGNNKLIPQVR